MRFNDVIGQEAVKRQLIRMVAEGRVPHALLLAGPEGTGKLPMAWNCPIMRARVYVFDFPKKAFTPSHVVCFLLIFIGFPCEGLLFQVFTRTAK